LQTYDEELEKKEVQTDECPVSKYW